jgi:DNA-binding XRE family transcriptional regulator
MKVQFRQTPAGEVAIMPRAEYERLKAIADDAAEDAGAARLVAAARRDVADGAPLLPLDVVERLANGENPIRVLREFRKWTQVELATGVGVKQNYLSEIETGKRKGPLELHRKIADCLGVPLDLLAATAVSPEREEPERSAKRKKVIVETKRQRGQH